MNTAEGNAWLALIATITYILGSFPTAYFVTKGMIGKDIRLQGSHNVGGMNAYSLIKSERSEKRAALGLIAILIGDMGKGVLAIYLTRWLSFLGYNPALALLTGSFFAILGHNYPFCFKFREGGIGFASLLGILLALNPFSLGVWGGTMLFCIFIAEHILIGRWRPNSIRKIISVIGTQIQGRLIGLGVTLVPIYFFDPRLFFPVLGPIILIYIKHSIKNRALVKKVKKSS